MSFFSRLTDIVTCNLSDLLAPEPNPRAAIRDIIAEMEEGLAGARRSVSTATANVERLRREIEEHNSQIDYWNSRAKDELSAGRDDQARVALVRKKEVEDLIAGLLQEQQAALTTRDHLTTTLRALEARLAEARRRMQELDEAADETVPASHDTEVMPLPGRFDALDDERARQIDEELEALRRALGRNG